MLNRIVLRVLLTIAFAVITTAQTAPVKNYYNKENKVGFKYPATRWKMGKEESNYMSGEEPGFTVLVDITRDDNALPGAIMQAEVSLKTTAIDKATCTAMEIGNIDPYKPVAKKIGNRTFYYVETSEGATGHSSETQFYRTFNDGRCYELAFVTYGENSKNRFQSDKLMERQFSAILRSLYFK